MPNRIVREGILTSERINALSPNAELFYRRLMSVVDDFGRYTANLTLLRAACYPLKLDSVKEDSIKKHLAECVDAGLIVLYTVAAKAFLEMQDFRQQVRSKESKYPARDGQAHSACAADATQMLCTRAAHAHLDVDVDVDVDVDDRRARRRSPAFVRPTVKEVADHCSAKGYRVDAEAFVAFYDSKGWKVGGAPMRDWRSATVTWHKRAAAQGSLPRASDQPSPAALRPL